MQRGKTTSLVSTYVLSRRRILRRVDSFNKSTLIPMGHSGTMFQVIALPSPKASLSAVWLMLGHCWVQWEGERGRVLPTVLRPNLTAAYNASTHTPLGGQSEAGTCNAQLHSRTIKKRQMPIVFCGWLAVSAIGGFPSPIWHLLKAYILGTKENLQLAIELEPRYLFTIWMADVATVFPVDVEEWVFEAHTFYVGAPMVQREKQEKAKRLERFRADK